MIPVLLVYLPNSNYLLGTFDFVNWWVSSGFSNVLFVKKGMQIYGEKHIAICKLTDGTWSIFQSNDYAQSWTSVFNIPYEIYDIVKINYGWALINTADGFYETVNSGRTWSKILGLPAAPNASAIANIGGGDILICTDGRYIWRSTNIGRAWSLVKIDPYANGSAEAVGTGDMQNIWHFDGMLGDGWTKYTGVSPACVAGACGKVLVGHGPWMAISSDAGAIFSGFHSWDLWNNIAEAQVLDLDTNTIHSCFPPSRILADRRLPSADGVPSTRADVVISQILVASVDGPTADDVSWIVKCDDLIPIEEPENFSTTTGTTNGTIYYSPVATDMLPSANNRVRAGVIQYTLVATEADLSHILWTHAFVDCVNHRIVFGRAPTAGATVQTTLKFEMSQPYSRVYKTFSGYRQTDNAFYGNYWFKLIYQQLYFPTAYEQLSSYDLLRTGADATDRMLFSVMSSIDGNGNPVTNLKYSLDGGVTWTVLDPATFVTTPTPGPNSSGPFLDDDFGSNTWVYGSCNNAGHWDNVTGYCRRNFSYDMGGKLIAPATVPLSYDMDLLCWGEITTSHKMAGRLVANPISTYGTDGILELGRYKTYSADALAEKTLRILYYGNGSIEDVDTRTYLMSGLLVSDEFPPFEIPQGFNIRKPSSEEHDYPHDSRNM